jgi:hypothetical protein
VPNSRDPDPDSDDREEQDFKLAIPFTCDMNFTKEVSNDPVLGKRLNGLHGLRLLDADRQSSEASTADTETSLVGSQHAAH